MAVPTIGKLLEGDTCKYVSPSHMVDIRPRMVYSLYIICQRHKPFLAKAKQRNFEITRDDINSSQFFISKLQSEGGECRGQTPLPVLLALTTHKAVNSHVWELSKEAAENMCSKEPSGPCHKDGPQRRDWALQQSGIKTLLEINLYRPINIVNQFIPLCLISFGVSSVPAARRHQYFNEFGNGCSVHQCVQYYPRFDSEALTCAQRSVWQQVVQWILPVFIAISTA